MDFEDLIDWLKILGIITIFIAISCIPAYYIGNASCNQAYSEYSPEFGFFSGCRIDYNGKTTPVDMIKNINLINK